MLGTGSGDVLAPDVSAGQLSWKINDCHPGGVRAISSLANGSTFYTSGADGMICAIDFTTGNLLEKFKASLKAVTSISVSPDGKKLATAAAQLKIFNCSNKKGLKNSLVILDLFGVWSSPKMASISFRLPLLKDMLLFGN